MKIEHLALWSGDIDRLASFYKRYLNATAGNRYHNPRKEFQSIFLSFDDSARLELMQTTDLHPAATYPATGYAHLAVSVGSKQKVDTLAEQFHAHGIAVLDGPRVTGDGYYECVICDPDGNRIEITV